MNKDSFVKEIQSMKYKNFYILEGEENYLKKLGLNYAIKKIVEDDFKDLNINYLTNPSVQELIECAEILPIMSKNRAVIVYGFSLFSSSSKASKDNEDIERFIKYVDNIPQSTVVFIVLEGNADSRKFATKACKNNIVSFNTLTGEECTKWIISEGNKNKKKIDYSTAQKLQLVVGLDTMSLKNEIDKLIAYVDTKPIIEEGDIDKITSQSISFSVFNMTDALLTGNAKLALKIENELIQNGENEFNLFAMLLRECRIAYYIKALYKENKNPNEISSITGAPPFAVNKRIKRLNNIKTKTLFNAYEYCINTDFAVKSGKISQQGIAMRTIIGINDIIHK